MIKVLKNPIRTIPNGDNIIKNSATAKFCKAKNEKTNITKRA
jgi:hypothetical protein